MDAARQINQTIYVYKEELQILFGKFSSSWTYIH